MTARFLGGQTQVRLNPRDDEPLCGAFESDPGDRVCSLSRGQTQMHLVRCGILPVFGALESDPRFSPKGSDSNATNTIQSSQ